ncbi:Ran-specific GTPase-activating protein 1 [Rhizoctonia solani]|uniref:Ran-specific GTPase-activating protein n=1 Tax=Rhizoctonia solani TaxID=456999 RepID=A0A8H8STV5_9AGAM|nr:Ran-specific GTPase-activating protein 1 [Rhizoctonia solani]QRW16453.1 Ran-specific GTPase-activating protein 1 [Rhizoctonia solani]
MSLSSIQKEETGGNYEPVHRLTEQVETKTHEETRMSCLTLFRFETTISEWKERGTGDVRLLQHKVTKKVRVLMRRDKTLKICANHCIALVTTDMKLQPNVGSDRSWVWKVAADISDGEPTAETLAIRFANKDIADEYKKAFEDAQAAIANLTSADPDEPPAAAPEPEADAPDAPAAGEDPLRFPSPYRSSGYWGGRRAGPREHRAGDGRTGKGWESAEAETESKEEEKAPVAEERKINSLLDNFFSPILNETYAASNVLIVGVKGLGVEIAKNIVLAGVKSVTLFDPEPVQVQDLGTQVRRFKDLIARRLTHTIIINIPWQFFLRESDVDLGGSPGQEITVDLIKGFQAVILTDVPLSKQLEINDWTHENGVHFISAETRGLFGFSAFNDFGPKFTCIDATGEQPLTGMVVEISKDKDGIVTCLDETRHGLEDGNFVTFSEVKGLEELNDCEPLKVTVKGPYTFSIGQNAQDIEFKSLRESLKSPEFFITDFAKFDRPATLHAGFQALSAFKEKHGHLPKPRNPADAEAVLALAKEIAGSDAEDLNTKVIQELAYQATGDIRRLTP